MYSNRYRCGFCYGDPLVSGRGFCYTHSAMYAIIQTGGKQYRVEKGVRIQVEKLSGDVGSDVEFPEVLLVRGEDGDSRIGQPFVEGSKVLATVVRQFRGPKILVFKKRSKKGYEKMQGHRQDLTEIEIKEVTV